MSRIAGVFLSLAVMLQPFALRSAEPPSDRTKEERLWDDISQAAQTDLTSERSLALMRQFLKAHPRYPKAVNVLYMLAESDFEKNDYKQAAVGYEKFLREHPRHDLADSAAFRLGECYYNLKVYNSAAGAWESLLQKYKSSALVPEAMASLAILRMRGREWGKADEVMKGLNRAYPHYLAAAAPHRENHGVILYHLGEYLDSARVLEGLDNNKAAYYRGLSFFAMKLFEDAVGALKSLEFEKSGPYMESAAFLKAEGFFQKRNFSLAATEFKSFAQRFPNSGLRPYALLRAAACALLNQDSYEALDLTGQVLSAKPPFDLDLHGQFIKACAFLEQKNYVSAADVFKKVSERPEFPDLAAASLVRMAWAHKRMDNEAEFDKALKTLEEKHADSPQMAFGQFLSGAHAFEKGDWDNAGAHLEAGLIRYPYSVLSEAELALMSIAYTRARRPDHLVTAANAALRIFENNFSSASPYWRAQSHFFVGKAYYDLKKFGQAIPFFERITRDFSDHPLAPAAQLFLAWCLVETQKYEKAVELASALIDNKKTEKTLSVHAQFLRGVSRFNAKDYDKALIYLIQFVKDNPKEDLAGEAQYMVGLCYHQKKTYGTAIDEWTRCVNEYPNHPLAKNAYLQIGDLYFKAGDFGEAAKFFKRFHQRWPDESPYSAIAHWQELQSYFNGKDYESAIKVYPEYLGKYKKTENKEDALKQLESVYYFRGEHGDPQKLEEFLRLYPKSPFSPHARFKLGDMAIEQKKWNRASQEFEQFIRDYPKDQMAVDAYYALGQAYENVGELDKAAQQYKAIMTQFSAKPTSIDAAFRLGMLHFGKERYKEAVEAFLFAEPRKMSEDLKGNLLYNIALSYENLGQLENAGKYYEKFSAVTKNPEQARETLLTSGLLFKKSGKFTEAIRVFNKFLKNAGSPETELQVVNLIAESYHGQGDGAKAIQTYEKLSGMEPASHDLRLAGLAQLAYLYEHTKNLPMALRVYEKIVVSDGKPAWVKAAQQRVDVITKALNPVP